MEDHFDYARRLALNQRWRLWLTPDEGKIFLQACKDQKTWSSFMRGTFEPVLTPNSEIGTENDPPSDSTDTAESESQKTVKSTKELNGTAGHSMPSKLMIATFRIREMIFEQLIPELYPANRNATAAVVELNSMEDVLLETASLMKPAPLAMPSKKTEDDYDDEGSEPAGETPNIPPTDHLERGSVARMDIPIDDAYYTFDEDVDALSYASALQDKSTKEDQGESDQEMEKSDTSTMNKDVHSSLKYLYMVVNRQAESNRLQNIKSLLDEVRPSRSKWASDNIGQEELYEALEKVLNDLKNYSGHSFPFLKPVSKREAPDYFDVIRHPMDLGTMTKKLSNCEYHSKQAFADDCYLIWSNCMQYNTIPADNVYRRHATAMRRKTTDLLKKVPDIVIAKAQADDDESEDDEESGSKHANQANGSVPPEFERPRAVQRSASVMSEIHERTATPFLDEPDLQIRGDPTPNVEVIDVMDTAPSEEFASAQFALQHSSLQEKRWRDVTLPYRHEYCNQRTSQLKRPFGERKAIVPTREMLGSSVDDEREYVRRNKRRRHSYSQVRNPSDRRDSAMGLSDDEELEIALEESHFPELKFPAGCVPELPQPTVRSGGGDVVDSTVLFTEEVGDLMESMPSMSDFPQIDPLDKGRLHNQISRNIRELRKVKEIHSKILAGEAGHQDESSWGSLIPPYQPKRRHPSALPPLSINRESAAEVAKQSVAKLLMHTGFDVASESALSTLSETFIEYFLNIGKSLRTYMNKYSRTMSSEDLLLHALQENGVENINQVDMYIRQDVERYGDKLYDLRRKMAYAYKDMIRRSNGEMEEDEDLDMDDAADDFMSGNFFGDLDLLNLRELGIDGVTSIPREVWGKKGDRPIRARVRRQAPVREEEIAPVEEVVGKPTTLPWRPVDINSVVGILKPFYHRKLAAEDMVEDEFKESGISARAKICLSQAKLGRKRGIAGAGDEPSKKKKKGPDPALKAQREAEKQRKAQEKANRQKQKEEQTKSKKSKGKKTAS